jgi:hypothetical protein
MAFASAPTGKLTFNLLDESGTRGKTVLHFPIATLVAAVFTAADALVPLIQAITDCTVTGYSATWSSNETTPAAAADGARVENKGVFIFTLANTLKSRIEVPGIKESVLLPSGSIDVENADVADFLTALIDSPSIFRGLDASDITSISSAYQRFNSSTKAMLPSDRVKFG